MGNRGASLRLPGGSPGNARLCPAGCQQRSAAVSSGPKPQLMPSAFMGKRSVASRVADRPVQLAEHRAAASRRPVGSAGLNLDARWFLLIVVSYMIGTAAALAPKINAASWADLAAGKDKVCGDSRHRDACVRRLQADETHALVTEASPLYLADVTASPTVYRDLLALTVYEEVKSMPRRDWLASVLIGHADDAEAGAVLLIDSQCAAAVSCGDARYCACSKVPRCRDWAAPSDRRSPFGADYPGGLYVYGLPSRQTSWRQACLAMGFRPAGVRYHWLGAAGFVRDVAGGVRRASSGGRHGSSFARDGRISRAGGALARSHFECRTVIPVPVSVVLSGFRA